MIIKPYCQKDYKIQLGKSDTTISASGCYLVSLASLVNRTPPQLNELFSKFGVFTPEGLIISDKAAKLLNLKYAKIPGNTKTPPKFPAIIETDYYKKKGIPQHFAVILGTSGYIVDPLDGCISNNKYNIISYRYFT